MKLIGIILLVVGIALAVALVPILFLGGNYPIAGLVAPLVCGSGSEIVSETEAVATSRGTRFMGTMQCLNTETGETSELTSMFLIIATVPAVLLGVIGLALYNAGAMMGGFGGMKEMQEIAKVPEVKAQLDALLEDFKAGRVSYEDYAAMSKNIIETYKARQTAAV